MNLTHRIQFPYQALLPEPVRYKQANDSHAQSACERLLFVCSNLVGSGRRSWEGNWILRLTILGLEVLVLSVL